MKYVIIKVLLITSLLINILYYIIFIITSYWESKCIETIFETINTYV